MDPSIAILLFGVAFSLIFLVLIFKLPHPTPFQYTILRIFLAIACAALATALSGFLEVQVQFPLYIKAGGALAVFVIVYYSAPAAVNAAQTIVPASHDFEIGGHVKVRAAGQKDVAVASEGIVAWANEMAKYRGQVGEIVKVEVVFGSEHVFRISTDDARHQWHRKWIERI